MAGLKTVLDELRRRGQPLRAYNLLVTLTRYHRVQGTEDIVEASKRVKEFLEEAGVEAKLEVFRGRLGLEESWFFSEPRGWRLGSAIVEKARSDGGWERIVSTDEHPLVAVVHSPPGSFEGRARLFRDHRSLEPTELPIFMRFSSETYFEAVGKGAKAVVASHTGPGIRYYGIFPAPDETPTAPAVSLPRDKAIGLDGERVRVTVEAEYRDPVAPILYAKVGEGPLRILVIAHVCHPTPGAHDNASGVAALSEALAILASREARLRELGVALEALIVPEYTGTALAFNRGIAGKDYVAAVSVDMVASRLDITGGSLNLYTSIHSLPSSFDPVLYRSLWTAYAKVKGFDAPSYPLHGVHAMPYSIGSDHDVPMSLGIPSSIVNEWPDHYYHTSLDSPENIEPNALATVASALAASLIVFGELAKDGRIMDVARSWATSRLEAAAVEAYTGTLPGAAADAARKLRDKGLAALEARLNSILGRGETEWPWERNVERTVRKGIVSSRFLRRSGSEAAAKLRSLPEQKRTVYTGIVALTLQATGSLEAARLEALVSRGVVLEEEPLNAVKSLIEGYG